MDLAEIEAEKEQVYNRIFESCFESDPTLFGIPEDERARCMLAAKDYSLLINRLVLSQLQPHFMFNVLNMIYYMCGKDVETARSMINDFATYLRTNMSALSNPAPIPFEHEIEHVHLYLRFEQMRFSDRFKMEYDLKALDFRLPPLTIQPLVENAVRHGVCPLENGGIVRIESSEEDNYYSVRITDNGVGFDVSTTEIGGKNNLSLGLIRARLKQICGGELIIHSAPGKGTAAEVRIPKN